MVTVTLAFSRTKSYFYVYYVLRIFTGMVCEGSVLCLALAYVVNVLKTPFSFFTFCRLLWNDYIFQRKDSGLWSVVTWLGPWFQVHGLIKMWIFGQSPKNNPFWKGWVEFDGDFHKLVRSHLLGSLQAQSTQGSQGELFRSFELAHPLFTISSSPFN